MRPVPKVMAAIWHSGQYVGDARPIARVTVQTGAMQLHSTVNNTYASYLFDAPGTPAELPNVRSVSWSRGVDTDFGSCSIALTNTARVAGRPGAGRAGDGWYSPMHGLSALAARWKQLPNSWARMLLPDNIVRTYEGYGCTPDACPELDPRLTQTGVWRIDTAVLTADGLITLTCRDVTSILDRQIVFPPVVPQAFYPLQFAGTDDSPGFNAGQTFTFLKTAGGQHDSTHPPDNGYIGPYTPPVSVTATGGDARLTVSWTPPPTPGGEVTIAGYQILIDGVRLATVYPPAARSATLVTGIQNGNVYTAGVVALYRQHLTLAEQVAAVAAKRAATDPQEASDALFAAGLVRPHHPAGPDAGPASLRLDMAANGDVTPRMVSWTADTKGATSHWTLIAYRDGNPPANKRLYHVDLPAGATRGQILTDIADNMQAWNYLLYATAGYTAAPDGSDPEDSVARTGAGESFYRSAGGGGEFYAPPIVGRAPRYSTGGGGATVSVPASNGSTKSKAPTGNATVKVPLKPVALACSYDDTSNTYYVGRNGTMFGHRPTDAFDTQSATWWMSVGNISPSRGFAYEWVQGAVSNVTVTSVRFHTKLSGYHAYISLFAHGSWIHYSPYDIIPYDPHLPESHNHGNVPFAASYVTGVGDEGPHTVTLRTAVPGVTKVRVTLRNLQDFGRAQLCSGYAYRAGVRAVSVFGTTGASSGGGGGGVTTPPGGGLPGPIEDDDTDETITTYETYVAPSITTGAGANPGRFSDYTAIIKLLVGWGGFFWPDHGKQMLSDGSYTEYDHGVGPYGLPNVDPELGGTDGGRIWGDLMATGTHAVSPMPMATWDKQSLMASIGVVKNIIGFNFFGDETGGIVWRLPNLYTVGNWITMPTGDRARTSAVLTIDETETLMGLESTYTGIALRERIFVGTPDGKYGALAAGWNPNPTGLRRVGGWTDYNFSFLAGGTDTTATTTAGTTAAAPPPAGTASTTAPTPVDMVTPTLQVAADMIQLRSLMAYHTAQVQCPGYPAIQVDDQVRVNERITGEAVLHYVRGVSSSNDMIAGLWTYTLDTTWLGTDPNDMWLFRVASLPEETQAFLAALQMAAATTLATDAATTF
jgi:hypothetical protein